MNTIAMLNGYLAANALLLCAALLLFAARALDARMARHLPPRLLLNVGYALLLSALVLPLVAATGAEPALSRAPLQVWSAPSALRDGAAMPVSVHLGTGADSAPIPLTLATVLGALVLIGAVFWGLRLAVDALRTARLIDAAPRVRLRGCAELRVSDQVLVPFSYWRPGRHVVVVPASLLDHARAARLALRHEAQHHRQGDTRSLYLLQGLRALFFWNPAIHLLVRELFALQELACDDAILRRHRGVAEDYYHCLFHVASSVGRRSGAVTCGMSAEGRRALLRRLNAILTPVTPRRGGIAASMVALLGMAVLGALSTVVAQPVVDRRISKQEASELVRQAGLGTALPLELNEQVLAELNTLCGTREGLAWVEASLRRMRPYLPELRAAIQRAGLPPEMLAVPFIESGFVNRPQDANPANGAGLWMFIAPTARHYGLVVNGARDERLDVGKETDAAMTMLRDLQQRFGDWRLAVLAYNVGSERLDARRAELPEADPWQLADRVYRDRTHYLARLVAGALILAREGVLTHWSP